jgi:hypothetical protein
MSDGSTPFPLFGVAHADGSRTYLDDIFADCFPIVEVPSPNNTPSEYAEGAVLSGRDESGENDDDIDAEIKRSCSRPPTSGLERR